MSNKKKAQEIAQSIIDEIKQDEALLACRSFAELHDHCDANMLGGQAEYLDKCGWSEANTDTQNEAAIARATDVLNMAQDMVSRWLWERGEYAVQAESGVTSWGVSLEFAREIAAKVRYGGVKILTTSGQIVETIRPLKTDKR